MTDVLVLPSVEAWKKAKKEGIEDAKIVLQMILKGVDNVKIHEITGLPVSFINQFREVTENKYS